ncbi:hypothetical protein [Paracoccus sp. Ld10]|uniref:hypothetical protein n=1 Tax=Paracoccus sp. Ld10 TaxID=649158 RepID=UPI003863CAB7
MPPDPCLNTALQRAAAEAHRIALGLGQIDAALGAMLQVTDAAAESLQVADLLRQEVEGLSHFLGVLAQQTPSGHPCDLVRAAAGLDLRAQAVRLGGLVTAAEPASTDDLW